jgi:hypothetical protein
MSKNLLLEEGRGTKVGVETSPSNERSGERGTVVMFKEDCCRRGGMDGQVDWALAMSRYERGMGKREMGSVALTGRGGGDVE